MKAQVQGGAGVVVEVEGGSQKQLFEEIAKAYEIFGVPQCGVCKNPDYRFVVRNVTVVEKGKPKEYKYYEYHCNNPQCRARLAFGCHQEGDTLFPKKKDDDGNYLPNNGWSKYEKPKE